MRRSNALRLPALLVSIAAMALLAVPASAGTDTANLTVQASVTANCTISTSTLNFGAYDPIVSHKASDLTGEGGVTVTCTNGAAVTITLGQGSNADAGSTDDVPLRRMTDGTNFIEYFLYSNEARDTVWGNTEATDVAETGNGAAQLQVVYGKVTMDQQVPAGSYSDTVLATVTF